jgi:hypothetical protein
VVDNMQCCLANIQCCWANIQCCLANYQWWTTSSSGSMQHCVLLLANNQW